MRRRGLLITGRGITRRGWGGGLRLIPLGFGQVSMSIATGGATRSVISIQMERTAYK